MLTARATEKPRRLCSGAVAGRGPEAHEAKKSHTDLCQPAYVSLRTGMRQEACVFLFWEKRSKSCSLQPWRMASAKLPFPYILFSLSLLIRRVFLSSKGERGTEGERDCKLSKRAVRKQEALKSTRESKMKSICRPAPGDM